MPPRIIRFGAKCQSINKKKNAPHRDFELIT